MPAVKYQIRAGSRHAEAINCYGKKINYLTWPLDETLYSETLNLHSQRSLILLSQQPSTLTSLQFNTDLSRKD